VSAFTADGYEVIIICTNDGFVEKMDPKSYAKFIPLKKLSPDKVNPFNEYALLKEFQQIYSSEQPDLILHYSIKPNIIGNLAAAKIGIPSICTLTGLGYTFLNLGLFKPVIKWLYKRALAHSSKIAFHNQDDLDLFTQSKIVDKDRCLVIQGSGVNTTYFHPKPNPRKDNKLVFLFVGRLLHDKGIIEFVEAAKKVKSQLADTEFWVVGDSLAENPAIVSPNKLEKWIAEGSIQYFGHSLDILSFYEKADVVVLPSYREGMPKVIIEALAMAKPIITTDTAGCKDTVNDGKNGFLIPVKDSEALVQAMLKIYDLSPEQRMAMGQESRALALEQFDEQIIMQKYLALAKEILNEDLIKAK